ncbi:MAG: (Fe-S)-binding protein [Planctomycetes bacterium]|nr:(Fe-S)-binding protein [Planctomycetota bacterium]
MQAGYEGREPPPAVVQLFPTCLVNEFMPEAAIAAVELIERVGIRVEVPAGLTCCGQPAWNAGFAAEAKAVARRTLAILAATQGPIVIPSGSCGDMLIHQTAELFRDEPRTAAQARVVASRCVELTQFLAAVTKPTFGVWIRLSDSSPAAFRFGSEPSVSSTPTATTASTCPPLQSRNGTAVRVAYHPSCHLARGLGIRDAPVELLKQVPGIDLAPLAKSDECCGFGGLFSVKQPELSGAMLDAKCRAIEASGAAVVASCDAGCLLHLMGGLRRRGSTVRACHVAELLAGASRPTEGHAP